MAKNGNLKTFATIVSIILGIAVAGTAIVVSAVRVESKVESHARQSAIDLKANTDAHKELKAENKEIREKVNEQKNGMTEIKTQIVFIREDMTEILQYIRGLPK